MKRINKFILLCTLLISSLILFACGPKNELVDYVSQLKLNGSPKDKTFLADGLGEVTLINSVDGDTAWFEEKGQEIKIRFCSVDTPESTGKIQPWGLAASKFTKGKLQNADSIVLQSQDGKEAKLDSTGTRYVGFVWYRDKGETEYKNLNLELVQKGYSKSKATKGSLYSDIFQKAGDQSFKNKLMVYSDEKDPEFDYTSGIEVSLKEINTNGEQYFYKRVYFEALVTRVYENYAYAQQKDADGKNYGVLIYLGYDSTLLDSMSPFKSGNVVRVSGFVQKHNDIYQIAGCSYNAFNDGLIEEHPTFSHTVSTDNKVEAFTVSGSDELTNNGQQLLRTLVELKKLRVIEVHSSKETVGDQIATEMTIKCKDEFGKEVQLRTGKLYTAPNVPVKESDFKNKTISSVSGVVDNFKGTFQLRIVDWNDVVFQ